MLGEMIRNPTQWLGGYSRWLKGRHGSLRHVHLDLDDSDLELPVRDTPAPSSSRALYEPLPQMEKKVDDSLEAATAVADSNGLSSGSDVDSLGGEWTDEEEKALVRK